MQKFSSRREAIKSLRVTLKLSKENFGKRIGKTASTVDYYERLSPPNGAALAPLVLVARQSGLPEVAAYFRECLIEDLGKDVLEAIVLPNSDKTHLGVNPAIPGKTKGIRSPNASDSRNRAQKFEEEARRLEAEQQRAVNPPQEDRKITPVIPIPPGRRGRGSR